jgi:regulator of protease activity HflC (stomatin/prohibitin superfamily)
MISTTMGYTLIGGIIGIGVIGTLSGIRIVRPTQRALIERFGKYQRFARPGFNWIIPVVDRLISVNTTEKMINAEPQEIITKDKLNAMVDAQIYFRVKPDEESVKNAIYNVFDYERQIVNLARTTLRNIIGTMTLNDANSDRNKINTDLMDTLKKETTNWGIAVVRAELKEINPPKSVQDVMNEVVIAENQKIAANDFATATETKADGARRAAIKEAEGIKQATILKAEGEAQSIQLVNEAANRFFVGNAVEMKKLEVVRDSLSSGSKYVIDSKSNIVNVISDVAGIIPLKEVNR